MSKNMKNTPQQETAASAPPPVLLSKDTNTALKEVINTIKTLENVYKQENKALNAMDSATFMSLQDNKISAARSYQNVMAQILARKNEIKHADPALKERMKNIYAGFTKLSQKNIESIERMQRCTERLGDTIRDAAIRAAQSEQSYHYGENGALSNASRKRAVSSGLSETA